MSNHLLRTTACVYTAQLYTLITRVYDRKRNTVTRNYWLRNSIFTMPLVGSVAAIVDTVALHSLRDASAILACKLVLVAPSLAPMRFVRSVETVWQAIAETCFQYALPVTARELVFRWTC